MIDANNNNEWTPPGKPADMGLLKVDDWCTSDQMFDARNKIEDFGKANPGQDVSLTVKFRSGTKTVTKTALSIERGDNWMTIDGVLRHRFDHANAQAKTVTGWGGDTTWGEVRNYDQGTQAGGLI